MNVLVIGGGISAEREISLQSSKAVLSAAGEAGHQAQYYDWDGSERWLLEHVSEFDVVLPILHGAGGEDGKVQDVLERTHIPFLGSGSTASALCFDKEKSLEVLAAHGIRIPKGKVVTYADYKSCELFHRPHILKPSDGGSSVDTFIYRDIRQRDLAAVEAAFAKHKTLLLEEFIAGSEITVPILAGRELPIIEIIPPPNGVFDYENKYNGRTQELIPAVHVNADIQKRAQICGVKIHQLFGCRHLSRVDMIVRGNDLYVLEINTMPGMTAQSLFPKAAAAAGLSFPRLVDYFITIAAKVLQ